MTGTESPSAAPDQRVSVVVVTRDRRPQLLRTLEHLARLPEQPPVLVVDNGSTDGTASSVRRHHPDVRVVTARSNLGAPARNVGVALARTPYVAFADDDSWWAPGALARAADVLDDHPRLAVLMARILVGPAARLDPVCELMAASPLAPEPDLPGPPLLGFVACGAVVRRRAFLDVGGFDDLLFFFGEEQVVALDLAQRGWGLAYVDEVVAHHHPAPPGDPGGRRQRQLRNEVLSTWMRRPADVALGRTASLVARLADPPARRALAEVVRLLPQALRRRRRVSRVLEHQVRLLERTSPPVVGHATKAPSHADGTTCR